MKILDFNDWKTLDILEDISINVLDENYDFFVYQTYTTEELYESLTLFLLKEDVEDDGTLDFITEMMLSLFVGEFNEELNEECATLNSDLFGIYEETNDDDKEWKKAKFLDSVKNHLKRNRGAYIGTAAGAVAGAALSKNAFRKKDNRIMGLDGGTNRFSKTKVGVGGAVGGAIGKAIDRGRKKKNRKEGKPEADYR